MPRLATVVRGERCTATTTVREDPRDNTVDEFPKRITLPTLCINMTCASRSIALLPFACALPACAATPVACLRVGRAHRARRCRVWKTPQTAPLPRRPLRTPVASCRRPSSPGQEHRPPLWRPLCPCRPRPPTGRPASLASRLRATLSAPPKVAIPEPAPRHVAVPLCRHAALAARGRRIRRRGTRRTLRWRRPQRQLLMGCQPLGLSPQGRARKRCNRQASATADTTAHEAIIYASFWSFMSGGQSHASQGVGGTRRRNPDTSPADKNREHM